MRGQGERGYVWVYSLDGRRRGRLAEDRKVGGKVDNEFTVMKERVLATLE